MTDDSLPPPEAVPAPRLGVRVRNYRGTILVGWADRVFELTEVAGFLWARIDGVRSVRELAAAVAAEYQVDDAVVLADVAEAIADLAGKDVVRFRS
jgi:Coenzyme PQQ synthesis protein D (PqqD)